MLLSGRQNKKRVGKNERKDTQRTNERKKCAHENTQAGRYLQLKRAEAGRCRGSSCHSRGDQL